MDKELHDAIDALQAAAVAHTRAEEAMEAARTAWLAASERTHDACRYVTPPGESTMVVTHRGRKLLIDFSDRRDTLVGVRE